MTHTASSPLLQPTMTQAASKVFHRTLRHEPVFIERAQGNYIYEKGGRKLLDACGGAAVTSIGHGNQQVIKAVTEQLQTVPYVHSGNFATQGAEDLAEKLCESSGMARAVFMTGGSEAVESAIKLARQYHVENKQPERVNFIARDKSYHGNSLGALGLCRHTKRRANFLPLFPEVFHMVQPCYAYRNQRDEETEAEYVERLAQDLEDKFQELGPGTVAAFFAEPVVGATLGCVPAVPGYLAAMRDVCHRHGALIVLDEIMCGMGRTGKMHAWQWDNVQPDIQTLGKGINGGYAPLSAVLIGQKVVDVMQNGTGAFMNGYTYQSSAIGCRAALEVLRVIKQDNLVQQCFDRGVYLLQQLQTKLKDHPHVGDIRGKGLFVGVEFVQDQKDKGYFPPELLVADMIVAETNSRGVLLYPGMKGAADDGVSGDFILICPPYTITEQEIDTIVDVLAKSIDAVLK